ncbi:MAG: T9SS type A sorting domain-containing protein [Rhodothermaceae bacterium]|nr:T9SS type A sorting domain-containing protein [Rhodothermaceae bacterium]
MALPTKQAETAPLVAVAETYNWPNPIRDGHTFFRCLTSESSQISITVVDAAGSLVGSLDFATSAGVPHEVPWNTSAASGIYFARVEATSTSGRTDSHLIKLAIIR